TRRSINSGGEVWWQIYGVGGELVAEYQLVSGTPTLKKEYGHRNGQLLVIAESAGTCQWLGPDALGTPRMIADQTGSLAGMKRRDYLPLNALFIAVLALFRAKSIGDLLRPNSNTRSSRSLREFPKSQNGERKIKNVRPGSYFSLSIFLS